LVTTEDERHLIKRYARGKVRLNATYDDDDFVLKALERMTAKIVRFIDDGNGTRTRSPADMFEFQERDLPRR
jgi:ArsR family metal-binding transcriptional regulator